MAQADQKGLVRALLQQGAKPVGFLGIDPGAPNERLDAVQPLVTLRQKMIETKAKSRKNDNTLAIAAAIGTARSYRGLSSARSSGM